MPLPAPEFFTMKEASNELGKPIESIFWYIEEEFLSAYVPTSQYIKEGVISNIYSKAKDSLKWGRDRFGNFRVGEGTLLFFNQLEILDPMGKTVDAVENVRKLPYIVCYPYVRISSKELETLKSLGKKQNNNKVSRQISNKDNPRSIHSLLKLILYFTKKHYKYDPASERSDLPETIAKKASLMDIDIDPKTVRKWLKEAHERPWKKIR